MTPNSKVPRGQFAAERERSVIKFARTRMSFTVTEFIDNEFEGRFGDKIPPRIYNVYLTACLDLQRLAILKGFTDKPDEFGMPDKDRKEFTDLS